MRVIYRVSFTGYRPSKLPFFGEDDPMCVDLKQRLYKEIDKLREYGADVFCTGMALGVDTWCAEAVLELQGEHPEIKLWAVIPCRTQDSGWSDEEKQRYRAILGKCERVICVSEEYTSQCMFKRNRALVDLCDILVAVYDGKSGGTKYTVDYAKQKNRKIITVSPM